MNVVVACGPPFRSFTVAQERFLNVYRRGSDPAQFRVKTSKLILNNDLVLLTAVQPDGVSRAAVDSGGVSTDTDYFCTLQQISGCFSIQVSVFDSTVFLCI